MTPTSLAFGLLLILGVGWSVPVQACGFGEAPVQCGQTAEGDARYMLLRVTAALKADPARALGQFTRGEAGFRTQDSYVFCVGAEGVMSAHPNPALQGQDVRQLHDQTGNFFIATMMRDAKPGTISEIRYLFPRPGGSVPVAKTTFYTRAADQVCGVGVYDGDETAAPDRPVSKQQQMAHLRERLTAGMPATLRTDWTAFLQSVDEQDAADAAVLAKAREQVQGALGLLTASR